MRYLKENKLNNVVSSSEYFPEYKIENLISIIDYIFGLLILMKIGPNFIDSIIILL